MIKPIPPTTALRSYFHAKDENRPHLLTGVFVKDATLEIVNRSSAIDFPAVTIGLEEIANVLVRNLSYPWSSATEASEYAPKIVELAPVLRYLDET